MGYGDGRRLCPDVGLTLNVFSPQAGPDQRMVWEYPQNQTRELPSLMRMRIHGGDTAHGVAYGVADCRTCENYADFGPRGPDDDEDADGKLVEIDVNHRGIDLTATCTRAGCFADRDLAISDLELVWEDHDAPITGLIGLLHPQGFSEGPETDWIQPRVEPIQFAAYDESAGMQAAVATLDRRHVPVWSGTSECYLLQFVPADWARSCPQGLSGTEPIDLTGLADGPHTLTLDAADAVGNQAERRVVNFRIDGTAPEPLTGLQIEATPAPTAAEWTRDEDAKAKVLWDVPAPDGGAPISTVHYRLETVPRTLGAWPEFTAGPGEHPEFRFPDEGAFRMVAWAEDRAGNVGDKEYRAIGYDTDAPEPPKLAPNGWLSKQSLLQGAAQTWAPPATQPELESGVCGYAIDMTRLRDGEPGAEIVVAAPKTSWPIPGPLVDGRHYVHVRSVSCAGEVSAPVSTAVDVDTVAPTTALDGVPSATWTSAPVTAHLSAVDDGSGADRVRWAFDGAAAQNGLAAGTEIAVPEGVHTLEYSAVDVAGNESEAQRRTVRIDRTAPQTFFEPRDLDDPTVVHAGTRDALSGVERAWIEMRADGVDGAQWQRIGPIAEPAAGDEAQLTGELPEEAVPAGRYALRVVATDRAGNSTDTGGPRPLAEPPTVTLPVRTPVALQVSIGRTVATCSTARGSSCRVDRPCPVASCTQTSTIDASGAGTERVLHYTEQAALVGSLTAADGRALAGMAVDVAITPAGGPATRLALRTGSDGRFQESLPLGASRVVSVRFAGTAKLAAATSSASLKVRSGVTLKLSRSIARGGRTITFSGQVSGAPGVSLAGKFVTVQWARRHHGWVATGPAVRADAQGRFRFPWELSPVSRRARIEFRAWVPSDGAWPFEDGGSPSRFLTVVP